MTNVHSLSDRRGGGNSGDFSVGNFMINGAEEAALRRLQNIRAAGLYVLGLRPYMDFSTGLVGARRRVSYQMFTELLEERRERGSKVKDFRPTIEQIRWLLDRLEVVGLARKIPQQTRLSPMLFRLPLATTGSIRLNEEPQGQQQREQQQQPQKNYDKTPLNNSGLQNFSREQPQQQPQQQPHEEPHTSGNTNNSEFTIVNSESTATAVSDDVAGGDSRYPVCPHSQILALWDEVMPAQVRRPKRTLWTSNRAGYKALAARWRHGFTTRHSRRDGMLYHDTDSGLIWWRGLFEYCKGSDFLMNHCRVFELDWLVKAENFRKLQEGKYHDAK